MGRSQVGKAPGFDPGMRWFESSRPSIALPVDVGRVGHHQQSQSRRSQAARARRRRHAGLRTQRQPRHRDVAHRSGIAARRIGPAAITGSIVDLTNVDFLDSTGLGALIGAQRRAKEFDGEVRLVVKEGQIVRLLRITGLLKIFAVYATLDDADQRRSARRRPVTIRRLRARCSTSGGPATRPAAIAYFSADGIFHEAKKEPIVGRDAIAAHWKAVLSRAARVAHDRGAISSTCGRAVRDRLHLGDASCKDGMWQPAARLRDRPNARRQHR